MELKIETIKVPKGRRRVSEDRVDELAASIAQVGLLHSIVVTEENRLIAGYHRLLACKKLEWSRIPVTIRELSEIDARLAEIDENLIREDLSPAERAELTADRKAFYLAKHPETKHGGAPGKAGGGKNAKDSRLDSFVRTTSKKSGRSRTRVSEDARRGEKVDKDILKGIAGTLLDTGTNLDALSRMEHDKQREVVKYAERKKIKNIKVAARNLKRARIAEDIEAEPQPLPEGPFRVIVADPPWKYDLRDQDETHRGTVDYSRMTTEEICGMDVSARVHEDCVLFLWTTNAHMHDAYHVLEAWGFAPKTIITWTKNRIGAGHWLRGQTEHAIMAVRGKPIVMLKGQSTALEGKVREHSRKPVQFYELVESLCPGSKLELFGREPRDGWHVWGAESEKFSSS